MRAALPAPLVLPPPIKVSLTNSSVIDRHARACRNNTLKEEREAVAGHYKDLKQTMDAYARAALCISRLLGLAST